MLSRTIQRRHLRAEEEGIHLTYFLRRTAAIGPVAFLAVAGLVAMGPTPVSAASSTTRTEITIRLEAATFVNLCNNDFVELAGDETIRVTRTTNSDGSSTVRSTLIAPNLTGKRAAPLPMIGYRGADAHQNYAYYAPAHFPYTLTVIHWQKLVPQGPAPTMYLVTVLRETLLDSSSAPVVTVDRLYLACTEPCGQSTPN